MLEEQQDGDNISDVAPSILELADRPLRSKETPSTGFYNINIRLINHYNAYIYL